LHILYFLVNIVFGCASLIVSVNAVNCLKRHVSKMTVSVSSWTLKPADLPAVGQPDVNSVFIPVMWFGVRKCSLTCKSLFERQLVQLGNAGRWLLKQLCVL